MFLYECIFEKNRPSSEKLWCHFNLVFPVMPDKVAFVNPVLIWLQPLPGKLLYLPLQQCLLLAENEFAFPSLWETVVPVSKQTKSMLQNCFEKVLKFWAIYYYYDFGYYYYYYYYLSCTLQSLTQTLFYEMNCDVCYFGQLWSWCVDAKQGSQYR